MPADSQSFHFDQVLPIIPVQQQDAVAAIVTGVDEAAAAVVVVAVVIAGSDGRETARFELVAAAARFALPVNLVAVFATALLFAA